MKFENRESKRKETLNLLDYVVIDDSGNPVDRAMARTLNVSEKGILLETHLALEKGQVLLITLGLKNDIFEVEGKIVRTEIEGKIVEADKYGDQSFCYGIEFRNVNDESLTTLKEFLKEFNEKK